MLCIIKKKKKHRFVYFVPNTSQWQTPFFFFLNFFTNCNFMEGIWPDAAVDRTEISSVHRSPDGSHLAVGDTQGTVRLFRYPCVTKGVSILLISSPFFFFVNH